MPIQDDRRVSKVFWSMVSKAADRSRRQRHEIWRDHVCSRAVSVEWCL